MAKPVTKDPAFDADDVQKLIKKAKMTGEPLPFAFGLASKPEECGFLPHLRRPGKALKKELKGASKAIGKVCFGTFTVAENDILLCSDKPVKGISKQLRAQFRKAGMGKFKPKLVSADGAEIDEDSLPDASQFDDSDPEDRSDAVPEQPTKAPSKSDLAARLADLKARIGAAEQPIAERLNKPFIAAVKHVGTGEFDQALAGIQRMEAALDQLAAARTPKEDPKPESEVPKATPTDAFKTLVARLGTLDDVARKAIMPQVLAIKEKVTTGDAEAAFRDITALTAQLDTEVQSPLKIWNAAKEAADKDISALANALKAYNNPALDRIAEHGITGLNGGDSYAKLTAALFDFEQSNAQTRADAVKTLLPAIAAYRSALDADEMVRHWEANPFGIGVKIRAPLTQALHLIEAQAAA